MEAALVVRRRAFRDFFPECLESVRKTALKEPETFTEGIDKVKVDFIGEEEERARDAAGADAQEGCAIEDFEFEVFFWWALGVCEGNSPHPIARSILRHVKSDARKWFVVYFLSLSLAPFRTCFLCSCQTRCKASSPESGGLALWAESQASLPWRSPITSRVFWAVACSARFLASNCKSTLRLQRPLRRKQERLTIAKTVYPTTLPSRSNFS